MVLRLPNNIVIVSKTYPSFLTVKEVIFSKTYPSFFTIKEGFALKSSRPSLPLKKAPPLTPALSPQERGRKPPYSVLGTTTL